MPLIIPSCKITSIAYVEHVGSNLQDGGNNGDVVLPGKGLESYLVKKINGTTTIGSQMPKFGCCLDELSIQLITTWINEGADNN